MLDMFIFSKLLMSICVGRYPCRSRQERDAVHLRGMRINIDAMQNGINAQAVFREWQSSVHEIPTRKLHQTLTNDND